MYEYVNKAIKTKKQSNLNKLTKWFAWFKCISKKENRCTNEKVFTTSDARTLMLFWYVTPLQKGSWKLSLASWFLGASAGTAAHYALCCSLCQLVLWKMSLKMTIGSGMVRFRLGCQFFLFFFYQANGHNGGLHASSASPSWRRLCTIRHAYGACLATIALLQKEDATGSLMVCIRSCTM